METCQLTMKISEFVPHQKKLFSPFESLLKQLSEQSSDSSSLPTTRWSVDALAVIKVFSEKIYPNCPRSWKFFHESPPPKNKKQNLKKLQGSNEKKVFDAQFSFVQ